MEDSATAYGACLAIPHGIDRIEDNLTKLNGKRFELPCVEAIEAFLARHHRLRSIAPARVFDHWPSSLSTGNSISSKLTRSCFNAQIANCTRFSRPSTASISDI